MGRRGDRTRWSDRTHARASRRSVASCRAVPRPGSGREFVEAATAAGPALVVVGGCDRAGEVAQASLDERLTLGDQALLESAGLHALVAASGSAGGTVRRGRRADRVRARSRLGHGRPQRRDVGRRRPRPVDARPGPLPRGGSPLRARGVGRTRPQPRPSSLVGARWALLAHAQMGDHRRVFADALDALDSSPQTRLGMMVSEVDTPGRGRRSSWETSAVA